MVRQIPIDVLRAAVASLLIEDGVADPMTAERVVRDDWQQPYMRQYISRAATIALTLQAHNMLGG